MAKLTLEELENLSRLLLSENDSNIELGIAILKNHQGVINLLCRELVLVWQLHDDHKIRGAVKEFLQKKYNKRDLEQWIRGFELFRRIPTIYTYIPRVQKLLKDHENIRGDYQKLMERNSKYCTKYYVVAKKLHQTFDKHLKIAETYYRIVLKTNPMHEDNLFYLAYLLDKNKEGYEEALKHYLTIESINPNTSAVFNNIGLIYDATGQNELAYKYYKKALAIHTHYTLYMRNLAMLCTNRMQGQVYKEEAKELLEKLIKIEPSNGANWNSWADYLWNVDKNYKKAEEIYLKGLDCAPQNPWLLAI